MRRLLAVTLFAALALLTACGPLVTQSVQIGTERGTEAGSPKPVSRSKKRVSDKQLVRLHNLLSRMEERVKSLTDKVKDLEPVHTIKYE